jgi:hypothetical protein
LRDVRKYLVFPCAALLATAGVSRADDAELKARLEAQERQIQELKAMIQSGAIRPAADADGGSGGDKKPPMDDKAVQKIVESYLKDHPGSGMPSGVQTQYSTSTGFVIRSAPDPKFVNWSDDCKIPFEMRFRGRIQLPWYYYKVTDSRNHLTGVDTGNNTSGDFNQIEVKRLRLIFEGTAFDPNLRYHFQLDGNTRGLGALANGNGVNGTAGVPGGNGIATVDHAVRLFSAYIAYDFHPLGSEKGCGPDCPEGTYKYTPTFTAIMGKMKPFGNFEEYWGSNNQQFVEYNMAGWFFDSDDDNLLMAAGAQIKALDDRLFVMALVTNGNETQIANLQMDDLKGLNFGFWYDFGGTWNAAANKWDLWGDCISDIDYSCNPVVRIGAAANLVPMDRRSIFTNAELNRTRVVPGAPGGTSLLGVLNGNNVAPLSGAGVSQFAADAWDSYTYDFMAAAKWRGFSIYNEWWVRDLNNFRGRKSPNGAFNEPIFYASNAPGSAAGVTSLFPANKGLLDYGTAIQAGYFVIPKKLEIVARYSMVRGRSGNINGDGNAAGQFHNINLAGNTVRVVNGAFNHYQEADEYAIGFNYFFKRHYLKWQNDLSFYTGGNPAAGGQSPAGFIPGVDGFMIRSQIQLNF